MKQTQKAPVLMNNLEAALRYTQAGLSIIPVGRNKRPVIAWEPYQRTIADEKTVRTWFEKKGHNLAVVTGAISGGLMAIGFDEASFFERWRSEVEETLDKLVIQKSGRGFHVFFRCPEPGHNQKLAFLMDEGEKGGRRVAIETRAEGGISWSNPAFMLAVSPMKSCRGIWPKFP